MKTFKNSIVTAGLAIALILFGIAIPALAYEKLTHSGNGVRVTVKPVTLAPSQKVKFELRMNTHSVELDQDFTAVSELRDDQGRSYRPDRWKGSPPGGHHRKGVLFFPALEKPVKSVTLIIRDLADTPETTFKWEVKP